MDPPTAVQVSPRYQRILGLSLPIMGGMVSQNVLNLVDAAMVGTKGEAALAATGLGGFCMFLSIAFITGLSAGVQATAARRLGEGKISHTADALNGGLLLAVTMGVPLTVVLLWITPSAFPLLEDDPNVVAIGVPYLQARLMAVTAVGMNFSFRGFWNGVNRSGLYMRTLVFMHIVNIILNYLLIFGAFGFPEYGAVGAGIATAISTWLGTAYYFLMGFTHARGNGFLVAWCGIDVLRTMLRLSIPAGLQTMFFAAGFVTLFKIIGTVGTPELAAANILINVMLTAILPGIAFGIAAGSLVGQALGSGDEDDAYRWGWDVVRVAVVVIGVIGLPMLLFPRPILTIFLHQSPVALELAILPMQVAGAVIALDGVGMVFLQALQGAGDTRRPLYVSVFLQWVVMLPLASLAAWAGYGLLTIWSLNLGYRAVQAIIFASIWQKGGWRGIRV
jgi:multidrug resistance protein, MATE family